MKKITILFCICLFIFISLVITASYDSKPIIVIDPGHGGKDGGCMYNDIKESDINLTISLKLKSKLEASGYKILMTRNSDTDVCEGNEYHKIDDLKGRTNYINNSGAILFLSIHLNMFSTESVRGFQIYYNKINENSETLATSINKAFTYYIGNSKRGIVNDDSLYILSHVPICGCLIECGFMSNPIERELLLDSSYQQKLVEAISLGVENYLFSQIEYI